MKFVMTQSVCKEGLDLLKDVADIYIANDPDPCKYMDELHDADALIVRIGHCNKYIIESSPNLKVIGRTGVGYDSIDLEAATKAGIPVVITPGANNRSVAEHTVAMMFALAKNLVEGHNETRKGNFAIRDANKAFELLNKKVGFIGLGAIGKETLSICKSIGMQVAAYDPYLNKEDIIALGAQYYDDYISMLTECDIISIHVPLTDATRNMISMEHIKHMKKEAILINCARGGIVNEMDLVEALNSEMIAGAAIDVFEKEPPKVGDRILSAKNIIYSPHSAAQTKEAVVRMAVMCIEGCLAVLNGKRWPYVADVNVYNHPRWNIE